MDFLMLDWLGKPAWLSLVFIAIVAVLLTVDLGVLNRKQREIGVRASLLLSAVYIFLGLAFGGWVWWYKIPPAISLGITFAILSSGIVWWLWKTRHRVAATTVV